MTLVSEKTLPLKNAIKDILLKIKNNETAMAMSGVGLGVTGVALSLPLFRYVGFDSLGGGTAFLVSTAISTVSAITALMGVYKLSSIAINKLSQALDPIANKIDDSVKNFKERLNGFWSAGDIIENRKNMTREEKAYNSLFYQRELFDAENYSALRGFRDKIADEASKNKDDRYDNKNIEAALKELESLKTKAKDNLEAQNEYDFQKVLSRGELTKTIIREEFGADPALAKRLKEKAEKDYEHSQSYCEYELRRNIRAIGFTGGPEFIAALKEVNDIRQELDLPRLEEFEDNNLSAEQKRDIFFKHAQANAYGFKNLEDYEAAQDFEKAIQTGAVRELGGKLTSGIVSSLGDYKIRAEKLASDLPSLADATISDKGASYADKKAAIFINELRSFTDKIKTAEEEYKYLGELFSKEINNYDKADWNAHPLARDLLQATGVISSRFAPGSSDSFENEIGKTEALSGVDSLYNALHQMTPEKRELLKFMSKGFYPSIFKDSQERGFDPDGELKRLETEKNADGHYASAEKIRDTREKMTARMDGFTNKADHDAFLESKVDIKNILEAVNKSPRVDIAPDAIDKLTAYREVFDKAINFLEENCKEANQADLVKILKTFNENVKVSGSKENMEKALENLQKEHLENINSFEYSVRNSKTGSILMSDAAFLLK